MTNLLGIHDPGGESWMADDPGWIVHTVALSSEGPRDYRQWSERGFTNIVRLNWGYGSTGTIPELSQYGSFAQKCADYVAGSPGCQRWIIGNEPNHAQERPNGRPITPEDYAECYRLCRHSIRGMADHEDDEVLVAAIAPWNVQTTYPSNPSGDWLLYFGEVLAELLETGCDGIALHTYTHGADPALITSTDTMDPPYEDRYFHFLAYQDFLLCVPPALRHLPVYITETDMDVAWTDANDGWIQNAVMEIDSFNAMADTQKILALCMYRRSGDQWALEGKQNRLGDFAQALALGISSPTLTPPVAPPTVPPELVEGPPTLTPPNPRPPMAWNPELTARGVTVTHPAVSAETPYWALLIGNYYDEEESQGRHHNFVDVLDENGKRLLGVPITHYWSTGSDTKPSENKTDPWLTQGYALDFPFNATWPSYGVRISDGTPSDDVWGLGYGDANNPNTHTSSYFVFQRMTGSGPQPPDPGPNPPDLKIVHPLSGATITQHWGQPCPEYAPGIWGHNGTDLAAPQGTPIVAIADGVVAWCAYDEGYGNYIRIAYPQLDAYSLYAHCAETLYGQGEQVVGGETAATVGSTGNSTGNHLHLEIRKCNPDGSYSELAPMPKGRVDPETWFALNGVKL